MMRTNRVYLYLLSFLLIGNHCTLGQTCQNNSIPDFFYNVDFAGPKFDQSVYTLPSRLVVSTSCNTSVLNFTLTPHRSYDRPSYNIINTQGRALTATDVNFTVTSSHPSFDIVHIVNDSYSLRTKACPLEYYSPYNRYLFELIGKQTIPSQPWIPPVTTKVIVQIDLENDNVHRPTFVPSNQIFYISEITEPGTSFGTVYASDADNDGIKYSINGTQFTIDYATGVLRLLKAFEPSSPSTYFVNVTATDDGSSCSARLNCTKSSNSTIITVILIATNKNSPMFLGQICGGNISFKEEQEINTTVKMLTVFDDDRDVNGQIDITFLSVLTIPSGNNAYSDFFIEPLEQLDSTRKAIIRAKQKFDYDKQDATRVWNATIVARDRGKDRRKTRCQLRINLVDINDNAPIFDKPTWTYTICRSTIDTNANGFLPINASDADSGLNGMIKYYIGTINVPYFSINHTSGMVMLRNGVIEISNLNSSRFPVIFQVYAVDRGSPAQMSVTNATVTIYYNDSSICSSARWADSRYQDLNITISEKFFEKNSGQVISDESKNFNGSIFFQSTSQIASMSVDSPFSTTDLPFQAIATTTVGQTFQSGILVTKPLDAEIQNVYRLYTRVSSQPPLIGSVIVNIRDENDQVPTFDVPSMVLSVVGNEHGNRAIGRVQAYDRDVDYVNNRISYRLNETLSDSEAIGKFYVISDGTVWTNATFGGANSKTLYRIFVTAYNEAPMWLPTLSSERNLQIDVQLIKNNDTGPQFINESSISKSIDEATENGTVVLNLTIIYPDNDTVLNLGIISGNVRNAFTFTLFSNNSANESRTQYEATGQLMVVAPLDFKLTSIYSLTLFAFNGTKNAMTNVTVSLQRSIRAPYIKRMPGFNAFIYETIEGESVPELNGPYIRAKDPDNSSAIFKFSVLDMNQQLDLSSVFILNKTNNFAAVRIDPPGLGRDLPFGTSVYNFAVNVTNCNGNGVSSYAPVSIRVNDTNNKVPIPTNSPWTIQENTSNPELEVVFEDFDDPAAGNTLPFTVDVIRPPEFSIIPTYSSVGKFTLKYTGSLDRATTKNLTVTFNASDNRTLSGNSTISIIVRDTLKPCPISDGYKTIRVIYVNGYENSIRDVPLGSIYVADCNDWYSMDRTYSILQSPQGFNTSREGWLNTRELLDPGSYTIVVNVIKPNVPSSAQSTINLQVESVDSEYVRQAATVRIRGEYPETLIDLSLGNPLDKLLNALASLLSVRTNSIKILTIRSVFQYRNAYDPPKTLEAEKNDAMTDVIFYIPGRARLQIECILKDKLPQFESQFLIKVNAIGSTPCCNYTCPRGRSGRPTRTIHPKSNAIDTNQTSFVGINILDSCDCVNSTYVSPVESSNTCDVSCNQPTVSTDTGPNGEILGRVFDGGYAIFDSSYFSNFAPTRFSLDFIESSGISDGLLFLYGKSYSPIDEFFWMALEIFQSKLRFHFRNTTLIVYDFNITPSMWYHVEWQFIDSMILVSINDCQQLYQVSDTSSTTDLSTLDLYLGGLPLTENTDITNLYPSLLSVDKFKGCIRNVLSNGHYLDMSKSKSSSNSQLGECPCSVTNSCPEGYRNVIIPWYTWLVIALVLLLLATICALILLSFARTSQRLKALRGLYVDDTRETIIDYKETAGEEDHSAYNLHILKKPIYVRYDSNTTPNNDRLDYENPRFFHRPSLDNYIERKLSEQVITYAHDTQLHYRDEGEGSKASDLSSISSLAVHVDRDHQYLRSLGPKFSNLAYLYADENET